MKSKIQKILSIPTPIIIKKTLKLPIQPWLRKIKKNKEKVIISNYLQNNTYELPNYFKIDINEFIQENTTVVLEKIEYIRAHKFNLLGSGLKTIAYDTNYEGFLGINYSNPKELKHIDNLLELLPLSHQKKSSEIRSLITKNYQPIDWWVDFRSGYRWNCDYYNQIRYGELEAQDIKVPWELARLQHLFDLSICCNFVNDELKEKIKIEIENQILDFISLNPPFFGPNWVSPMEISIRSLNIIFSLINLNNNGLSVERTIVPYIINYLKTSFEFIKLHTEWNDGLRNNHYFANLLGMAVLSKFLYGKDQIDFQYHLLKKFKTELKVQFFKDGGNFEGSIPYHFFTFEIVFWFFYLFKDQLIGDKEMEGRLKTILEFNHTFKNINPKNIQIGDNDSGKILSINSLLDINYNYLKMSEILSKLINYKYLNDINDDNYNQIYDDFGLIFLKRNDINIFISTGRKAQFGKGGHNHNDSQSFVLNINDLPIFVDPGTYVYTASTKYRNKYRSASYHNKISKLYEIEFIDEKNSLFWCFDRKVDFKKSFNDDEIYIRFNSKKNYFNRSYIIDNKGLMINDFIKKNQNNLISNFHIHPNCEIEFISENEIRIMYKNIEVKFNSSCNLFVENYNFSPDYGVVFPAKKIVVPIKSNCNKEIKYYIKYKI